MPADSTFDFADSRPELKNIPPGEAVLALEKLEGFERVVQPVLDRIDAERRAPRPGESKRRGITATYHAIDYWRLEMLRRVIGARSTEATRDWLAGDKAAATRSLLGFNVARRRFGGKARRWMTGIPCDGWMSDFRNTWLKEAEFAQMAQLLERWALAEKLMSIPGIEEECRVMYADGSKAETHGTPPKRKHGQVVNDRPRRDRKGRMRSPITAPDAGFVPNNGSNADHAGAGWNVIFITTSKGTVLAHRRVPIHHSESKTLTEMITELGQVLDQLKTKALRVLSTDAAFTSQELRREVRNIGVLENIHLSSHAHKDSAKRTAAQRDGRRYDIKGYPNWQANGHRELLCRCGEGKVSRVTSLDSKGRAIARLKGECNHCGSISITSGAWRLAKNPNPKKNQYFTRCLASERDHADLTFGNPLTYNDEVAAGYGVVRFNSQEGLFGSQFTQRFGLLKGKRWFYRQTQLDLEVSTVVTITHALSLERLRRMQAAGTAPPGYAPALAAAA